MSARIREVMTSPVLTATRHETLEQVRWIMHRHAVGALPIVDPDGVPVGIVTVRDVACPDTDPSTPVEAVMGRRVATVTEDDEAGRAARIMQRHGLHHLLVTRHAVLVGIVSAFDMLGLVDVPRGARASA